MKAKLVFGYYPGAKCSLGTQETLGTKWNEYLDRRGQIWGRSESLEHADFEESEWHLGGDIRKRLGMSF